MSETERSSETINHWTAAAWFAQRRKYLPTLFQKGNQAVKWLYYKTNSGTSSIASLRIHCKYGRRTCLARLPFFITRKRVGMQAASPPARRPSFSSSSRYYIAPIYGKQKRGLLHGLGASCSIGGLLPPLSPGENHKRRSS